MPQHPAYGGKKLNEAHKQKLLDGGISEEIIAEAGVFSVTSPEEIRRLTGVPVREGGGTAFPYPGETDFVRVRLDVPQPDPQREGKKMKYVSPVGAGCRLYVPPRADIEAETVIITEGEKKALAAVSRGLNCFGVAGIDAWRERGLLGEKLPPMEALLPRLKRDWSGQKVVLVYDSDIDRRHDRWDAFPTLAEVLYSLGADEIKIITLPKVEGFEKTGLDDFFVAVEQAGGDAVEEFWKIVNRESPWIPIKYQEAAEKFASKIFSTTKLDSVQGAEKILNAAVSMYVTAGDIALRTALKAAGFKYTEIRDIQRDAKRKAEKVKESQSRIRETGRLENENSDPISERFIVTRFPPAAQIISPDYPFPPVLTAGRRKNGCKAWFDIRNGQVVMVEMRETQDGEEESVSVMTDTVILLTKRLTPIEEDTGIEKWEVAQWEDGAGEWVKKHLPSHYLFDSNMRKYTIQKGLLISSENADEAVHWLHALRCAIVQGKAPAPTVYTVSRCGWHTDKEGKPFFVLGREILKGGIGTDQAEAGDREEASDEAEEEDIIWSEDMEANERQILQSFARKGDPKVQRDFLLEMAIKYPQVAVGIGAAAGAPLLKFACETDLSDVAGFVVAMLPTISGNSKHQGKTTWNRLVASIYGLPDIGSTGRLRFAYRTQVSTGVLLSVNSDLPVHLEEVHLMSSTSKKNSRDELEHFIQQISTGMDKERGSKYGGGRRTKSFRTVCFWTAERDVTLALPPGSGAHDRVLKLPPLLPDESDENREEAERIENTVKENYGHAGYVYLNWLLKKVEEANGIREIQERIRSSVKVVRNRLPSDSRRASAGRLAKRAGIALEGLFMLFQALNDHLGETMDEKTGRKLMISFLKGWEMVVDGIPSEDFAEAAFRAAASYIAENQEYIRGLRDNEDKPPNKWLGAVTTFKDDNKKKIECVCLTDKAFSEAMAAANLDAEQAKRALAAKSFILTRTVKSSDGRSKKLCSVQFKLGNDGGKTVRPYGVAFPINLLNEGITNNDTADEAIADDDSEDYTF